MKKNDSYENIKEKSLKLNSTDKKNNEKEVLFYISQRSRINCITPEIFSLIEAYCQKRGITKRHIILAKRLKDDDIKEKILRGKYKKVIKVIRRRNFGLMVVPDKNYCWLTSLANSNLKI